MMNNSITNERNYTDSACATQEYLHCEIINHYVKRCASHNEKSYLQGNQPVSGSGTPRSAPFLE
ncbi:protein of unknown function [Paraburkholderia kururiensis]